MRKEKPGIEEKKIDFSQIEKKWQKEWEKAKIFEANSDKREKYFVNFPYPYINAYLHLGHAFSSIRVDVLARYKRMLGMNVLFPQAWHITGTPVSAAAQRIKEKEPKQIAIMKSMGFLGKEIEKFKDIKYWNEIFVPAAEVDFKRIGASVDWRRSFITTELNPRYDKFIRWQFRKLKERGFIEKGKYPAVWCPKDNMPVGDHDRVEGEGYTTQDFIWIKFKMKDSDLILMAGTTRPDALYGQTHLWIDPKGEYVVVKVKKEKWVVGKEAVNKIKNQYDDKIEIIKEIKPKELIGKWVRGPLSNHDIYTVPAWFIKSNIGSGIVYSALEDPVDLFELKKIHSNMKLLDEFKLDKNIVSKLHPIAIINVSGMGDNLGEEIGKEFKINSPNEGGKVEDAKAELNKRVFRKGVMRSNCGKCAGMSVPECQIYLKKKLSESGEAVMFYELEGKVVCRCLTPCVVKVTSDQWFLKYNDSEWKKLAHRALDRLKLYPDVVRQQFNYVIDWLREWACTHHQGLGTKLPWDEKWVIESLSDSTIYMSYYTIAHLIRNYPVEKINDEFFDFVLLGKGKGDKEMQKMRQEFEYWYPFDVRSTAKDLVQNHMSFCIFNHVAIFPEKYWPRGFSVNGWLLVDGEKMSKSRGNFFTIRQMLDKLPADIIRANLMLGGEGIDDPNFDFSSAENLKQKIENWYNFATKNYKKTKKQGETNSDRLLMSVVNRSLREGTQAMENMMFRTGFEKLFHQLQRALKEYLNKEEINQQVLNEFIETQTKVLQPFCPHITEEIWHKLGNKNFVSLEKWPMADDSKINIKLEQEEQQVEKIINDIKNVINMIKEKQNRNVIKAFIYVIPKELELYINSGKLIAKKTGVEASIFANNDKSKHDPENKSANAKFGRPSIYLE